MTYFKYCSNLKVKSRGNVLISGILLILQGFCGMSYGLFISALARDEREAVDIAIGSVFPSLLISGTKYYAIKPLNELIYDL